MFIFGLIIGGVLVAAAWYLWETYGREVAKAADAFASGLPPKE